MKPAPERDSLGFLGLARRAGAVVVGVPAVRDAVGSGEARLVIMAGDASPGRLQKVQGILAHRDIPVRWVTTRERLGEALGRPDLSVAAIMTHSFAEQLSSRLPTRAPEGRLPESRRGNEGRRGTDRKGEEDFSTDAGR